MSFATASSEPSLQPAAPSTVDKRPLWLATAVLVIVAGLTLWARWHMASVPLERDEGEYAYMGQLLLQGVPPYQAAYNMKFPGTYLSYAVIMGIFGQSILGIRIGLILVNAATALGVGLLGRRWGGPVTGLWSAAIYLPLTLTPGVLGPFAHATHFVTLFAVWGFLVLDKALTERKIWLLLLSGALFSVATLMKQHGAVFGLLALLWFAAHARSDSRFARLGVLSLVGGLVLPLALTGIWLALAGVFDRFWFWTFTYASSYATHQSKYAFANLLRFVNNNTWEWALWALSAAGLLLVFRNRLRARVLLLGWLVAAFLSAMPGMYFRAHYFIPLMAPLALCGGHAVHLLSGWRPSMRLLPVAAAVVGVMCLGLSFGKRSHMYYFMVPEKVARTLYGNNPFAEMVMIGDYLKKVSTQKDRIAVIGSEPELYFYANRRAATGYLYTYPLMEEQPYASQMQRQMAAEIERTRPKYLVFVNVATSWLAAKGSDPYIFDWFTKYQQDYDLVLLGAIYQDYTDYVWKDHAQYQGKANESVTLYRLKSR